jgi:hypothetical protein
MAAHAARGVSLQVYRGAYENLPDLDPVDGGRAVSLAGLPPFDASVIGWGSFSHLRSNHHRVGTLRAFGAATEGPVVVSFLQLASHRSPGRLAGLRRSLRARRSREPGDAFSVHIGFYHVFDDPEVRDLARRAGLDVVHFSSDDRETNWPHAVLRRRT